MDFGIEGVRVGHWTDAVGRTGCTVVEVPVGTVASAEVRGGAPASRELDVLSPLMSVAQIDAVLLTGGSVFGLRAADGVVARYAAAGRGVATPAGPVPIVPTLALFDLAEGDPHAAPDAAAGAAAVDDLSADSALIGAIGAGTGAMTGHWRGADGLSPGGLGFAVRSIGDVRVAVLCAVNAFGDIDDGGPIDVAGLPPIAGHFDFTPGRAHTTIGVVVTNARLDKTGCLLVAQGAHDGLARSIVPAHTRFDGDAFVAAATGTVDTEVDVVRLLAVAAAEAAVRSVRTSPTTHTPNHGDSAPTAPSRP